VVVYSFSSVVLLLLSKAMVVLSGLDESVELSVVEDSSSVVLVSSVVVVRYLHLGLLVVVLVVDVLVVVVILPLSRLSLSHSSLVRIPLGTLLVVVVLGVVCLKDAQLNGHRLGVAFTDSVVSRGCPAETADSLRCRLLYLLVKNGDSANALFLRPFVSFSSSCSNTLASGSSA